VIGSPVDSANESNRFDGVSDRGSNCVDDESVPIDSRNVSGSDGEAGSYYDREEESDDDQDHNTDDDDGDDGSELCTRDEELSVPGDDEGQSQSDYDSSSLTPSSDGSCGDRRPVIPPLDLR
jgi:hypothetical protein